MEDVLTYIIVFGVFIGGVAVWHIRRSKPRPYILSVQRYPELEIQIIVRKQDGKTNDFVVQIYTGIDTQLANIYIELLSAKRESEQVAGGLLSDHIHLPLHIPKKQKIELVYPFLSLKKYLTDQDFAFKTFRVVVMTENQKKIKSHELAFNKNWVIYRPDSGKYN